MIDDVGDRLLDVPMDAGLLQPPEWPFAGVPAPKPPLPAVGDGAPRVGTVWTVGMAGGGVVERDTVTALEAVAGEDSPVDDVPRVGVMRWIEGADDVSGAPLTSGSAAESGAEPPSVSIVVEAAGSGDEFMASGRSPMSWAVTVGASELSTTGGLSTGDGSDHSPPTPGAPLPSEVGGGWAAPGPATASVKELVDGVEVLPWGALTTGRSALAEVDGALDVGDEELGDVGAVVLRWTIGVAEGAASEDDDVEPAEAAGRSTEPSVGASDVVGVLAGAGSVPRETVTGGVGPSAARRETVGAGGVETTRGIATGGASLVGVASAVVGVPVPPSPPKGTGVTAPRVGACSSAIRLTVGPTGNDLGEAGAAICSVTAGGSGAGDTSTADEIMGGPSPPRRRAGAAAGASTSGIAGDSVERWTMGAPTGVAPDEPEDAATEVTVSPDEPRVGDSAVEATGSGSDDTGSGADIGTASGIAAGAAGAASTTGRFQGSGVSTEPGAPEKVGAGEGVSTGLTERSTGIPDGSAHRCTTDVPMPFGVGPLVGAACTTGRSATSPPRTGTASTTPEGASGVTACPSADRKPVVCLVASPAAKSCGGLTSGCVPSTRWTGGSDRQSRRATGAGGTGDGDGGSAARSSLLSRLQGHRMVHRPPFTRVLSPAIWLTYSSLSACSRSRMSSRRQWKW